MSDELEDMTKNWIEVFDALGLVVQRCARDRDDAAVRFRNSPQRREAERLDVATLRLNEARWIQDWVTDQVAAVARNERLFEGYRGPSADS